MKQKPGGAPQAKGRQEEEPSRHKEEWWAPQQKVLARAVRDMKGQGGQAQSKVGSGVRWGWKGGRVTDHRPKSNGKKGLKQEDNHIRSA